MTSLELAPRSDGKGELRGAGRRSLSKNRWASEVTLTVVPVGDASGNTAEIRRMSHGHADALVRAFRANKHVPGQAAATPSQAESQPPDTLEQLRKLGELRDAGVLTPEEFEAKKAILLDRI